MLQVSKNKYSTCTMILKLLVFLYDTFISSGAFKLSQDDRVLALEKSCKVYRDQTINWRVKNMEHVRLILLADHTMLSISTFGNLWPSLLLWRCWNSLCPSISEKCRYRKIKKGAGFISEHGKVDNPIWVSIWLLLNTFISLWTTSACTLLHTHTHTRPIYPV